MSVKQLSVFLENRPGTLSEFTGILAQNNVNMRALSLADTYDFGIARIITDNPEKAAEIVRANSYVVNVSDVTVVEVSDSAGSLDRILKILGENGVNIEYMYGFTGKKTDSAYMIIRPTDVASAEPVLEKAGIHIVKSGDISSL